MGKVERIQYQAALAVTGSWQGSSRSKLYEELGSIRYINSFFPDAIASWNVFIRHFNNVPSFVTLKDHIISFLRPKTKSISVYMIPWKSDFCCGVTLTLLLIPAIVIKASKIQVISYFHVHLTQLKEQLLQLV